MPLPSSSYIVYKGSMFFRKFGVILPELKASHSERILLVVTILRTSNPISPFYFEMRSENCILLCHGLFAIL
jgi:hypothetical protein